MSAIWFTSDNHFWHKNIIGYCNRPFTTPDGQPDVEKMNDVMVERWNANVGEKDEVWHLGDFSFGNFETIKYLVHELHGVKHLVKGNHDRHSNKFYYEAGFTSVRKSFSLDMDGNHILLVHRPPTDLGDHHFALCGHVHDRWREQSVQGKRVMNVGVDVRGFAPTTLYQLLADRP